MKVLYVVGANLSKNTSANMSHNAYVQGLLENKCDVDIIMAKESWGELDKALPRWEKACYYEYHSEVLRDKIKNYFAKKVIRNVRNENNSKTQIKIAASDEDNFQPSIRKIIKKLYYLCFPQDPVYPLEKAWLKSASQFKSTKEYDIVISNSSPAASHKLVSVLTEKKRIRYKRWIQIWEDPWYFDLYGGHTEEEREEEHFLLRKATEIFYVSPLTLEYQKQHYIDCAYKMKCIPLPFYDFSEKTSSMKIEEETFGYFGDYYAQTRNLVPFYEALVDTNCKGFIYGDSNVCLKKTEQIEVCGRVTLDKLANVQSKTAVLVHLCNLKGGQIPGKIYHYSATDKPILFILDGTSQEKKIIQDYFKQFNRYYFCDNNKESISKAISELKIKYSEYKGVEVCEFRPKDVIKKLFESD